MSPSEPQVENERLKKQLAERDAAIIDRDAKIEKLARDLAALEAHIKRMLVGRRGGHLVSEGQGLLFPSALGNDEHDPATAEAPEEGEDDADDVDLERG